MAIITATTDEYRVNTTTVNDQRYQSITTLTDGTLLVTWLTPTGDGSGKFLYGQRYNPSGSKIGSEFSVIEASPHISIDPSEAIPGHLYAIAPLNNGGYAVVWNTHYTIAIEVFDSSGSLVSAGLLDNNNGANTEHAPSIAPLADGGFVVAWHTHADNPIIGYNDVHAQRFTASGSFNGPEINASILGDNRNDVHARVAGLSNGGFVITWSTGQDVRGRLYDAFGVATGPDFEVSSFLEGQEYNPALAALSNGGFVVAWSGNGGPTVGNGLVARMFDASGAPLGDNLLVSGPPLNGLYASITEVSSGGFVVSWMSSLGGVDGDDIYTRAFGADGTPGGEAMLVNQTIAGQQGVEFLNQTIAPLPNGGFAVTWRSDEQDGSFGGIFARTFAITSSNPVPGPTNGNDILYGDENSNIIDGLGGDDEIFGLGSDDSLYGGPNNDVLDGGPGADRLDGGAGSDTATYANAAGSVFVRLGSGSGTASGADGNDTLFNMENVTGSQFDDEIAGNDNDNLLDGSGGADVILGGGGNDSVIGGNGDDFLQGGLGNDQLSGGADNDVLRGNGGVDSFNGGVDDGDEFNRIGDGVSFLERGATQGAVADLRTGIIANDGFGNIESMVGIESLGADTAYADTFYGNDERNSLWGNRADILYGFGGDDIFPTGSAPAVIEGGSGTDTLVVGTYPWLLPDTNADGIAETADFATSGWTINLSAGTMVDGYGNVGAVTGVENVNGSQLGDSITGDANANVLNGSDGDDILEGHRGNDTLLGGTGSDAVSYADASGGVTVKLFDGTASGADGDDVFDSVENAIGSAHDDILVGNFGPNRLEGGAGNDFLVGGLGNDVIDGGTGALDYATFYFAPTTVGSYSLVAGTGADAGKLFVMLTAGAVSEAVSEISTSADGSITVRGIGSRTIQGTDTVFNVDRLLFSTQSADPFTIPTMPGFLVVDVRGGSAVTGVGLSDIGLGTAGADSLIGAGAVDALYGFGGDDTISGDLADDLLDGGAGSDTASYASASGGVVLDLGAGTGTGADGNDTLVSIENAIGSPFSDVLTGSAGANRIEGGGGSDRLIGGGGGDTLIGGAAADTFVFTSISDSQPGASDVITGFSGKWITAINSKGKLVKIAGEGDKIDLSAIDADVNTAGDQAFTLSSKFTGVAGQAYSSYNAGTGLTSLFLDVNGDRVADTTILFGGQVNLGAPDFFL